MDEVDQPENEAWYALFHGRVAWEKVHAFLNELKPVAQHDLNLWADLKDLMQRAVRDGLPYDRGEDGRGFKWPMERAREGIGHLKMDERDEQHRIYFAAPSEIPSALLALLYGPKRRTDPDWYVVQNAHIDEADQRCRNWRSERAAESLPK